MTFTGFIGHHSCPSPVCFHYPCQWCWPITKDKLTLTFPVGLLKLTTTTYMCSLFPAEISRQTVAQLHPWLDRSTKPSFQHASNCLSRPREWNAAGKTTSTPEAGDGGLEPRVLEQTESYLQQGSLTFFLVGACKLWLVFMLFFD